ncbi:phosphoribosyltransferase-like protein [Parapusillimonas granuli]|uniref:PRTase-CE domain-containing protein n=1 Tax=Parapusillimonas granuli TaxID=380911 RepID=A0A853FWJ8_9BURK|nr:hypothetical protein [Parapusillimonas granuli]MBB5216643.1 hypothetical protein [Parapusillimonas granuli]NYT48052.1 hypothetical protein [Parapusillimonas granuli]
MSQRIDLLASIANTIQDYRNGSLPQPIPEHVDRWVQQFDAAVQLPILQEIDHVLKKIYFSKEDVAKFLRGAMRTAKLTGDRPDRFWRSANFLDIQGGGSSQTDMLALFSEQLEDEHGFGIDDCGQGDEVFIYLDDGIFTGNRVRRDLENWIRDHAPAQAKVHVICIALHSGGQYYAGGKIQDAIRASRKSIGITWWRAVELEDRRAKSTTADVLRPTVIPNDPAVQAYVAAMKYQPTLRTAGNPGTANLYSSDAAKILLEQEFLKAGVRIRQICPNLGDTQRPLGHMTLETLGFGSLIVTYRNCPNNAPLAFWVDAPWYPLFPRTTNTQTAVRRMFADLGGDL